MVGALIGKGLCNLSIHKGGTAGHIGGVRGLISRSAPPF